MLTMTEQQIHGTVNVKAQIDRSTHRKKFKQIIDMASEAITDSDFDQTHYDSEVTENLGKLNLKLVSNKSYKADAHRQIMESISQEVHEAGFGEFDITTGVMRIEHETEEEDEE